MGTFVPTGLQRHIFGHLGDGNEPVVTAPDVAFALGNASQPGAVVRISGAQYFKFGNAETLATSDDFPMIAGDIGVPPGATHVALNLNGVGSALLIEGVIRS